MPTTILLITLFLLWLNFLPPLAYFVFRERFSRPLDNNRLWIDQRPVFGSHKTIRGLLACILGGGSFAPLLGITWLQAALAAFLASVGDLLSSFLKRRFGVKSGRSVILLDHIFEGLFPALLLGHYLDLPLLRSLAALLLFLPLAWAGSAVWRYLTYRPPLENYPRLVRSTTRFREWRACHAPLARWQTLFNLSSFLSHQVFMANFFKIAGLHEEGVKNTLNPKVEKIIFSQFFF